MIEFIKKIDVRHIHSTIKKFTKEKYNYIMQYVIYVIALCLIFKYHVIGENNIIDIEKLINAMIIVLITVFVNIYLVVRKRYINSIKETQELKEYIKLADEMNFELRRFKHNYLNILSTLYAYIDEDTNIELRKYFLKIVEQCRKVKNTNISGLSTLNIMPLKSLLVVKINIALSNGIFVETYFDEKLVIKNIEICDLCEIIGVFLDNAIDECQKIKNGEKKIVVCIMNFENHIQIEVKNSYNEKPDVFMFYWNGYSTKGEGRGTGLRSVKKIMKEYDKTFLNTYLEEDNRMLVQELIIEQ